MNTFILYAMLCTGLDGQTQCQAYELDYNLSASDCDSYLTDSGLQEVDVLMSLYIPSYKAGMPVILSCGVNHA